VILSITQRPRARIDLLEQFVYFGEEEGIELAERYFSAVDETCTLLVKQPRIGGLYDSGIPELAGLRRISVKGFENYLIFYLPHSGGIDVIRVIHGARDIENLFKAEDRRAD
jgi:toxin ParE1/3/4